MENEKKKSTGLLKDTDTGRVNFNVFFEDINTSAAMKQSYKELFKKNPQEHTITTAEIRTVVYALLEMSPRRNATGGKGKVAKALVKNLSAEQLKEIAAKYGVETETE